MGNWIPIEQRRSRAGYVGSKDGHIYHVAFLVPHTEEVTHFLSFNDAICFLPDIY